MTTERTPFFDRAQLLANEIAELFRDTRHWNEAHPDDAAINPDPDGELQILYEGLTRALRQEGGRRLIMPLFPIPQDDDQPVTTTNRTNR